MPPTYTPFEEVFGDLFHDVQTSGIFADSKTFIDATAKQPAAKIMQNYHQIKRNNTLTVNDLKDFVLDNFDLPSSLSNSFETDSNRTAAEHIENLWDVLTRQGDQPIEGSSLIPLPNPYIVPGGRFGEIYYWDSYFTMLGLAESGRYDMIENMLDNFAYLIDTIGFIPNGNRTYFLGRSQPPFFAAMVNLLAAEKGNQILEKYLSVLQKEYDFWMAGAADLSLENPTHRRVVRLQNGTIVNRYWDDRQGPRPESYAEDLELAEESKQTNEQLYQNLRAACESGWDFSARWFAEGTDFKTIRTTELIPVDLNCLMFHLEETLSTAYLLQNKAAEANDFAAKAEQRKTAIQTYCWNIATEFFEDYHFPSQNTTGIPTLAAAFPLFFNIAKPSQAAKIAKRIQADFLKAGGVVTTLIKSGQQWDFPNGWAPLQWVTIQGLRNYGFDVVANKISDNWTKLNLKVYENTGKMMEKYNVTDMNLGAGGGEYPVQDGFGWTNGVLLKLLNDSK
ncbi:MAG: alpha,alpha-trehalase TreF [Chitinophagales bacterium]